MFLKQCRPFFERELVFLRVAAFFPESLKAWNGRKSAVVYTAGCNFECKYCYAHSIVREPERLELIPRQKIMELLVKNYESVNSAVVSGGEPLVQGKALVEFLQELRSEGFSIKLDTNGSDSFLLEELIAKGLLDFVSLDLKSQLNDYAYFKVTGKKLSVEQVLRSIQTIKYYGIDHEFRITFVPELHSHHDVLELSRQLKGSKCFVIQQFVSSEGTLGKELEKSRNASYEELLKIARQVQGIDEVRIRTLKGDETIKPIAQSAWQRMLV